MKKQTPRCLICSSESSFWATAPQYGGSQPPPSKSQNELRTFDLYKCNGCGHGFFHPGISGQEELNRFYDEAYAQDYSPEVQNESFIKRKKQYELDLSYLREFLPDAPVNVLDFGCSTGQFLKAMPDHWQKSGLEVNPYEIEFIRKNYKNIRVYGDVKELKPNSYDVITLRGVIEHLFAFEELFSVIRMSLKKNGTVYICATPDFNSPCSIVYRERWNQIGAPLHYHQFTAASLAILFAQNGFGLKGMHYDYIRTAYADFRADALAFVNNVKARSKNQKLQGTQHAYPGTMITAVFEDIVAIQNESIAPSVLAAGRTG